MMMVQEAVVTAIPFGAQESCLLCHSVYHFNRAHLSALTELSLSYDNLDFTSESVRGNLIDEEKHFWDG